MKIEIRDTSDGVEIPVLASPGSRRNEFRGIHNRQLKISVTAIAEKGKANQAIIQFLAKQLGIPKSRIELVSGTTASSKRFLIRQATAQQILQRLSAIEETR